MDEAQIIKDCEENISENGFIYYDDYLSSLTEEQKLRTLYRLQSSGKYMLDLTPDKKWIIRDDPDYKVKTWTERHPGFFALIVAVFSAMLSLGVGTIQSQSENREYKTLQLRVQNLSDSIAIFQKHIIDSARHK